MSSFIIDGVKVRLDSFETTRTYGGIIVGRPNADDNRRIVEGFVRSVKERDPYETAFHVIEPAVSDRGLLPAWACAATFVSNEAAGTGDGSCGSTLVLIWFQSECPVAIGEQLFSGVTWKALARNFDF